MGIRAVTSKIDLPEGAKLGLRDASGLFEQEQMFSTAQMDEQLQSLAIKSPPKLK